MKAFIKALKRLDSWIFIFCAFIFSLLRLPSLIEPLWYGDEGIYQVIGFALRSGKLLYRDIWDNKPPVLYLLYASVNGDLFGVKLLSLIFGIFSIAIFILVAKELFKNRVSIFVSAFSYAVFFGLPYLEGNIANAENFMHLPILLSLYLILKAEKKSQKSHYYIIAGIALSTAFLTKIVGIFDFLSFALIIFLLRLYERKSITKKMFGFAREETLLSLAFILPILLTIAYFISVDAFSDYYRAAFSQNVGYVGYENYFLFPMGKMFLKIGILFFFLLLVFRYYSAVGRTGAVLLVWMLFSLFGAFFSNRPYTHYVLEILPSFCLLLGVIFERKKVFFYSAVILLVAFIVRANFNLYKKITPYYINYLDFAFGSKGVDDYQSFFDRNTPRDYEIGRFVTSKTTDNEKIFLWGDSGQIYFLSNKLPPGRYIVAYHITFYKDAVLEVSEKIKKEKPKYIIQTKNDGAIDAFLTGYVLRYKIRETKIYEREPQPL